MMKQKLMRLARLSSAAALAAGTAVVNAAPVDVTSVTTAMTDNLVPIAAVGAGVLVIVVSIVAFKWIRRGIS